MSRSERELSHPLPYSSQLEPVPPELLDASPANGSSNSYRHTAHLSHAAEGDGGSHLPPARPTCAVTPFAFVATLAVELSFVLGIVVLAKLSPAHAVDVAASTTAVSVAGLYCRNAVVTIGRRLIGTAGHDNQ